MMFFTPGRSLSGSGGSAVLAFVPMVTSTSGWTKVLMAASAAFTTDFLNGSVSFSKMSEKLTFMPSMRRSSSSISFSMMLLPLPG